MQYLQPRGTEDRLNVNGHGSLLAYFLPLVEVCAILLPKARQVLGGRNCHQFCGGILLSTFQWT